MKIIRLEFSPTVTNHKIRKNTSRSRTSNALNPTLGHKHFRKSPSSETKWEALPGDDINGYSLVICHEDYKAGIQSSSYKSQNKEEYE